MLNVCVPNNSFKIHRGKQLQGEADKSTIIIRYLNAPLSVIDTTIGRNQERYRTLKQYY